MFQYFSTIYSLHVLKYTLEILGNLRGGEIPTSLSSHRPIGTISSQQMSTNTPYFQIANSSTNHFFSCMNISEQLSSYSKILLFYSTTRTFKNINILFCQCWCNKNKRTCYAD